MKIGFNMLLWTPFVTEEHFPLFEPLKATGYDGVELEVFEGTPEDYAKVGQVLKDNGLASTAVTIIPDEDGNPLSPDPGKRQRAVDCTHALGAEMLCGPYYQPLGEFSGQPPTEQEKARAVELHQQAADYAVTANITMALEGLNRFECYFLNTVADTAAHVRRVDRPNFGLQYDSFHANIEEKDPIGCLDGNMDILRHVHISANDRGTPGLDHIAWDDLFHVLKHGGYDGWLTIEAFGRTLPDLAATTCVWRDLSASNEEVYTVGFKLIKEGWEKAQA